MSSLTRKEIKERRMSSVHWLQGYILEVPWPFQRTRYIVLKNTQIELLPLNPKKFQCLRINS